MDWKKMDKGANQTRNARQASKKEWTKLTRRIRQTRTRETETDKTYKIDR